MTISILNDILLLKDKDLKDITDYLSSINLSIFDAIISKYSEKESKQIILYLLCAYSEDSPMVILRQDSKEEKQGIADYIGIPEILRNRVFNLTEDEIRQATTKYLTQFAGPLFKSLMFLRIQYEDFELGITNKDYQIINSKGEGDEKVETKMFDTKEHGKAIAELSRLAANIDKLEKQIRAQVKKYEGIEDLNNFQRDAKDAGKIKGARTGNVENNIK